MKQHTQPQRKLDRLIHYYWTRTGSGWRLGRVKDEDRKTVTVQPLKPGSHFITVPREDTREVTE